MFCPREPFDEILRRLEREGKAEAAAPSGGAKAFLLSALAASGGGWRFFVVSPEPDIADILRFDCEAFLGGGGRVEVMPFPAWELLPSEEEAADLEVLSARLSFLSGFRSGSGIGISSLAAFLQPVPSPEAVAENTIRIELGREPDRERLLRWLSEAGYVRQPMVTAPGEFAVRGGIIDIYPLHSKSAGNFPLRIEFLDDTPSGLRLFEVESQRSVRKIREAEIGAAPPDEGSLDHFVLSHLDPDTTVLVLDSPRSLAAAAREQKERFPEASADFRSLLSSWKGPVLRLSGGRDTSLFAPSEKWTGSPEKTASFDGDVCVFADHDAQAARMKDILLRHGLGANHLKFARGFVSEGFVFTPARLLITTDAEIMNTRRLHRGALSPARKRRLVNLLDLSPGDYVVHVTRGIARYNGIEKLEVNGRTEEFLSLLFADQAKVYVPTSQFHLVQPYLGPSGSPPDLTRLGSGAWRRKRKAAEEEARNIARKLLRIQAARRSAEGIPFPPDDELQEEFEAAFPYEETPDQLQAAEEIRRDMTSPHPMERLLCGDVGFGKTEVAMRAAFRAVRNGSQVLLVAPTTILADQHFRTFSERFREQPVTIELLSRFRSPKERGAVVEAANAGRVDILIGTHSLLRGAVRPPNTGLVIIDEEHRFGVRQKEALKERFPRADFLLLSATPIPRTLNMALSGLMDISSLKTPPRERLAVRTTLVRKSPDLVRRVVLRELARGGQVYYLHNRVETIRGEAKLLSALVPEARVLVLHGKMSEKQVADGMARFLNREFDVLVATTIIESGLDIPSVNTMLVDMPERLGLAELHQLRGRVGRYRYRAYCYLMLPPHAALLGKARKRLKALEELQHLGAGFDIALRDLEIRGMGDILGLKQWGKAADVGLELYLELLRKAAGELKGSSPQEPLEVSVSVFPKAFIPEDYIPDGATRLDAYRQIAKAEDDAALEALREEFDDRFGPLPREAENLFRERSLAILMEKAGVTALSLDGDRLRMRFRRLSAKALQRKWRKIRPEARFLSDGSVTVDVPPGETPFERARELLEALS